MSRVPFVHLDVPLQGRATGELVVLGDAERHHVRTVLRLSDGARLEVADGAGASAIGTLCPGGVRLESAAVLVPPSRPSLLLAQALATGRRFDDAVRRATELGADAITALVTGRSVRLDAEKVARTQKRWQAVARAASEQARRARRPHVAPPRSIAQLLADAGPGDRVLVAHPGARPLPDVAHALAPPQGPERVVLAVGPEGGFSDDEVAAFEAAHATPVGLGPTVLRTEHAGAAALAVLAACTRRWEA